VCDKGARLSEEGASEALLNDEAQRRASRKDTRRAAALFNYNSATEIASSRTAYAAVPSAAIWRVPVLRLKCITCAELVRLFMPLAVADGRGDGRPCLSS
jgi:hypothetical protein